MKIAVIRKKYIFHGGAESFSQKLVTRLADAGHEVHIYAITWEGAPQSGNIYSHRVPAITFNSTLRDLSFALSACRLLKKEKFDIVQSHDKTLCQDIYRAGDGCHIEWLRQRWKRTGLRGKLSIAFNPYHRMILLIERMIFNGHRFRKVIAISELVKRNILEHYHVDEKDIEVVYNGVDLDRFSPLNRDICRKEIRKRYSIPDDGFLVLFVGSGFERKGVRFLLKAAELVASPLTVLIAGKGPERKYRHLVKRQNVIFCGPQKEIHKYYSASDIFVFPAIYEPFGNVHLEALASGLPVITTSLSGAAEIIRDGVHGFVITLPEDCAAIAEKIRFLMDNPKKKETMGTNARKLAEEFSFERYTERILDLYETIVEQKAQR
jgi:UDP-glucose:(heptosyl)LPS alpha-1,3-glucosyltransferase